MPTLAHASIDLPELKIHRFPSMDAFNAAVGNSQIGITDISFVAGDTSDVPLPTAQDQGYVLTAGASGSMYWGAGGGGGTGGATALNELSDVNIISTLASDQVLTFNGSSWVNQILWLDDLRDVTISGASDGQVLTYVDGSGWINSLPSWGGSSDHDLTYEVLNPTTNSLTLTFASGTRGYKYINLSNLPSAASSVQLAIVINNNAENYIMINNQTQTPKYIDFVSITYNGVTNSNVNTTSIVPEYDTWHNVEAARCKEYSINVVPTINKPIITCTDNMADLSYV